MKIIETLKEIWKENKVGYLISAIIVCFGSFFIYARQHNRFTFNFGEFFVWLPIPLLFLLIFMFAFCLFLGDNKK